MIFRVTSVSEQIIIIIITIIIVTEVPGSHVKARSERSGGVVVGSISDSASYMEFVDSLLFSERFSLGYSGFPLFSKTCI